MPATCFPPATEAEAKALGLHHCLRLLPHYHDTGAFFVCAMTKLEPTLPGHDYGLGREDEPQKQSQKQQAAVAGGVASAGLKSSAAAAAADAAPKTQKGKKDLPKTGSATGGGVDPELMAISRQVVTGDGETLTTVALTKSIDPPDWTCLACKRMNYHNRSDCFKCHTVKGEVKPPVGPSGQRVAHAATPPQLDVERTSFVVSPGTSLTDCLCSQRGQAPPQDDYTLVAEEDWETQASLKECKVFFDFADDFPYDCVVRRGEEASAKLFLVSRPVKQLLQMDVQKQLKLISAGIKVLHYSRKTNVKDQDAILTDYRLCQESVGMIRPLLGARRVLGMNLTDFAKIVEDKIADKRTMTTADNFTTVPPIVDRLQKLEPGSFVIELAKDDGSGEYKLRLHYVYLQSG